MNPTYDLIFLALTRWDAPYSSTAWSLAKALSRHRRVLYLDNPFTWKDVLTRGKEPALWARREAWSQGSLALHAPLPAYPQLRVATPPAMLPVNFLPPGSLYDQFSAANDRSFGRYLGRLLPAAQVRDYVLVNVFNPFYGRYLPRPPRLRVYYSVDAMAESRYVQRHGPRLEQLAMQQADLILATATELERAARQQTTAPVHLLPNAADVSLFWQARGGSLPCPPVLAGETRPVLAYMGSLDHRMDYELLAAVARLHADKLLLLIGPQQGGYEPVLEALPNVKLAGRQPLEALPAFLARAQVGLIPFRCNALTRSIYPLKLNEYLAAGLPVVATPFSPDLRSRDAGLRLANGPEDFAQAIGKALAGQDPEKAARRDAWVKQQDWPNRAKEFEALVAKYAGTG
jgi:teichuronic acid biosynthesis glycosyltransferase TuaH